RFHLVISRTCDNSIWFCDSNIYHLSRLYTWLFFDNMKKNDIVGTITEALTTFPYKKWKREHSIHHATSSNLDKRGIGDIWVMTVDEYVEAFKWQRLFYRLYRNPLI